MAISMFSASGTAEPSHMCDWKIGLPPPATTSSDAAMSGSTKSGERGLGAVVGVQRDRDRVALGDLVDVRGEGEGAGRAGLDGVAGEVVGAAGGDLEDAVGAGLGQALEDGVDRTASSRR